MTRFTSIFSLFALALAVGPATASAQSVQDFQLPPNPAPTATPTPTVQGPVDSESGAPVRPRPIPTPVPTPVASPTPSPVRSPVATPPPRTQPRPQATQTITLPANRDAPAAPPSMATPDARPEVPDFEAGSSEAAPRPDTPAVAATPNPAPGVATVEEEGTPAWWWFVGLGLLAVLAIGIAWWLRRSRAVPLRIEPPVVRKDGGAAIASPRATLTLRPEAIRLSRSVMAATLSYRLTVLNRGAEALTNVVIEADLGSASGDRPVEEQVAMAATALEPRHTMPRLSPGQSARFEGRVQLQLSQAGILRQGNTPLLVPLLRLRATAESIDPQAQTVVIGQQGTGGSSRLQPFRLDEGPRGYEPLAQRVLD